MRFLLLFTIALTGLSASYLGFIHVVDPYGEQGTGKFPVLVLDSRRAKLHLLHRFAEHGPVDGLILGSSRCLLMDPDKLAAGRKGRIFNFAVDNAHAEDFLAIYHYALAQGIAPKVIVVGLDVVSLQSDDIHDHMFDRSDLRNFLEADSGKSSQSALQKLDDTKALYTKDYLKDGFKAILMEMMHQTPKTKFRSDGYEVQYSGVPLPPSEMSFEHDFTGDVKGYLERISGMRDISPKRVGYLTQLFSEARQHNAAIVVWLTPIHPKLNELMASYSNYADLIEKVNKEARQWVADYGIHYTDYSNVKTFGGIETAWDDSTHMDPRNMERVAHALAGDIRYGL